MCNKLRFNALPVRSRTTRGRAQLDRSCRAGCRAPETLNHVIQQCHQTHGARIDRHNSVASYLQRNLQNKGWNTEIDPRIPLGGSYLKPDIVAIKDGKAVTLDVQIITDAFGLDRANQNKINKYSTWEYKRSVREKYHTTDEVTIAATLNWRGIWSPDSAKQLLDLKIIHKQELQLLSTRVLIGGIIGHRMFCQSTMSRTGVG